MHATKKGSVVFMHEGDYDGDVIISVGDNVKMLVPFEHLKSFVVDFVRQEKMSHLENAPDDDVLGI
jgi:hypothetical protein